MNANDFENKVFQYCKSVLKSADKISITIQQRDLARFTEFICIECNKDSLLYEVTMYRMCNLINFQEILAIYNISSEKFFWDYQKYRCEM